MTIANNNFIYKHIHIIVIKKKNSLRFAFLQDRQKLVKQRTKKIMMFSYLITLM